MLLSFLLAASIPSGILVSTLNPHSLVDSILFNAPRTNGMEWVNSVLANFCPAQEASRALLMLQYRNVPYQKFYEDIEESPERQIKLFEALFDATNKNGCHETFFSPGKLQNNLVLARKIFLGDATLDKVRPEVRPVVYYGNFFAPGLHFRFDQVYRESQELAMAMLYFVTSEQMGMVGDWNWLDGFLGIAEEEHIREIFNLLLSRREMTPDLFQRFMFHYKGTKPGSLVDLFPYPSSDLPYNELLMRCALLLSCVYNPEVNSRCSGLEPHDNLDELQRIALDRGDRQSISTFFYWKSRDSQVHHGVPEMLSYVGLGGLSPLTTLYFTVWAFYMQRIELGDWPLEHLQGHLSLAFRQVTKEDRLSKWLCSDALVYKDVDTSSLDDLYDKYAKVSINMRFTKPVEMSNGQVVTWAAEYFILNARILLDTYRSDQQALEIPIEDCQKITVGILYALAEGQHFDFSNTELEMREGDEEWIWFKRVTSPHDYTEAAETVLKYLNFDEIYEFVHRAVSLPSIQDEQVKRVIDGIERLFID